MDADVMTEVMGLLDRGENLLGKLDPSIRARVWAVVENPTQETWDNAFSILVAGFTTLWVAVGRVGYPVTSKPMGEPWPQVPTRQQLIDALRLALG